MVAVLIIALPQVTWGQQPLRIFPQLPPHPLETLYGEQDDGDADGLDLIADDDQADDHDEMIYQIVQELFLGTIVYAQEKNEWQFNAGYFQGNEFPSDAHVPLEIEYGITDRFQIGMEFPLEVASPVDDFQSGVSAVEWGVYYNPVNDPVHRWAVGIGYDVAVATSLDDEGNRLWVHEPYLVGYQEIGEVALNLSGRLEIATTGDETEIGGELALGMFREFGNWVPMLELANQWEEGQTQLVMAPGLFWKPRRSIQLGASLPIGLNDEAPALGAFALLVLEYGGRDD